MKLNQVHEAYSFTDLLFSFLLWGPATVSKLQSAFGVAAWLLGFVAHYYHSGVNHTNSMIKYAKGAPILVYNAVATLQPLFQRVNHRLGRRNCP